MAKLTTTGSSHDGPAGGPQSKPSSALPSSKLEEDDIRAPIFGIGRDVAFRAGRLCCIRFPIRSTARERR